MDRNQRLKKWTDQPDCTPEEAKAIVTQEDTEELLRNLELFLYSTDEVRLVEMMHKGLQNLLRAIEAEAVVSPPMRRSLDDDKEALVP